MNHRLLFREHFDTCHVLFLSLSFVSPTVLFVHLLIQKEHLLFLQVKCTTLYLMRCMSIHSSFEKKQVLNRIYIYSASVWKFMKTTWGWRWDTNSVCKTLDEASPACNRVLRECSIHGLSVRHFMHIVSKLRGSLSRMTRCTTKTFYIQYASLTLRRSIALSKWTCTWSGSSTSIINLTLRFSSLKYPDPLSVQSVL